MTTATNKSTPRPRSSVPVAPPTSHPRAGRAGAPPPRPHPGDAHRGATEDQMAATPAPVGGAKQG
jgi:hypothetical protein